MSKGLTQKDLAKMGCAVCGKGLPPCGHSNYLSAKCHLKAGLAVSYSIDGAMVMRCAKCAAFVARFEIAIGEGA